MKESKTEKTNNEFRCATIRRVDTDTDESREITITDAEEYEEIYAIMSVIALADFRRKLFRAIFIVLCIVTAVMLIAYITRYETLLNTIIAAGLLNIVNLQRYCHWTYCGRAAVRRCEQFFERQIAREETNKLTG